MAIPNDPAPNSTARFFAHDPRTKRRYIESDCSVLNLNAKGGTLALQVEGRGGKMSVGVKMDRETMLRLMLELAQATGLDQEEK